MLSNNILINKVSPISNGLINGVTSQFSTINADLNYLISNPLIGIMTQISETHRSLINGLLGSTIVANPLFGSLTKVIDGIREDPNSIDNWYHYYDKMSEFFWVIPYKMEAKELHRILSITMTEKDFDNYIIKYFNKDIVDTLIIDIKSMLKRKEDIMLFKQIITAYNNKNIIDMSLKYEVNVQELVKPELYNTKMNSEVILKLSNFDDIGMYHNYTSKVMPGYTQTECDFLEKVFIDKKEPVLDVMCGYGRIANELVKRNYKNVYGVDFSDYSFLNVDKDFIFSKDDFFHYRPGILFKYLYSLYNCYENKEYLRKVIAKITELSADNAFVILDVFNKEWRDKIDSEFYKLLIDSFPVKLEVSRHYDDATGVETTKYLKTMSDNKQEEYSFSQKFFTQTEIEESIDYKKWDIDFLTSDVVGSRNNNQKRILVLKRR